MRMGDSHFRAILHAILPAVAAIALAGDAPADDGSADGRFLAGLRQRGLYTLAEAYCRRELARPDLTDARRADLVIEWSRSLAEQAASAPPDRRESLWSAAVEATEAFASRYPESPRLPLVRFQAALGMLARGELARQEAELAADRDRLLDEARRHLRAAVAALEELAADVERRWREQNLLGRRPGEGLSADQLHALRGAIEYELARALRNQAQCYPADSDDRANSLTLAVKRLEPLASRAPPDALSWKARLDLVVCRRLLGDHAGAVRLVESLLADRPPAEAALRLRAELIRLALPENLDQALAAMSTGRELDGRTSPELDLAWLETCLAGWRAAAKADDAGRAAEWRGRAEQIVRTIDAEHGPFWSRRAETLLSGVVRAAPQTSDAGMLVRAAESAYRGGRIDEALDAYDRARRLADEAGDEAEAFRLGYVAATIEHQRGGHAEAIRRYRELALGATAHPQAAAAHLLAVHHAGRLVRPDQGESIAPYAALLEEHLSHWGEGATAGEARRRLGQLRKYEGDWPRAVAAYRAVPPEDPKFAESVAAAAACYTAWLAQRQAAGEPTATIADEAAEWLRSLALADEAGPSSEPPAEPLTELQRDAALTAASLWLRFAPGGSAKAESLLAGALRRAGDAPDDWRRAAQAARVAALAGSGRRSEAAGMLAEVSGAPASQILDLLEDLGRAADDAPADARRELAGLQLQALGLLGRDAADLPPERKKRLDAIRAEALTRTGQTDEAIQAYRALAAAYPRDGALRTAYAELLLGGDDPASLQAALDEWREVERFSPEGSPGWFRAKYHVASLHERMGNHQQAARIVALLKLLHPDLGGPELRRQFEELLERCRQDPDAARP
jgi:hypothetical protein